MDVTTEGSTIYFLPSKFDKKVEKSPKIPTITLSNLKHMFAVIGGDASKGHQTDLLIFCALGVGPLPVFVAKDFDLAKIDPKNPKNLTGKQVGNGDDEDLFCPVAVTSCPHHERFTEITSNCGQGDARILTFVFNSFENIEIHHQFSLDRLLFGTKNLPKLQENQFELTFCPGGSEFFVFDSMKNKFYGM